MSGKGSALDDLMMACSDLSGNSKRSGFKGPPVKDIRREAPKQMFQPSTKARDWRALDQNLESVFGSSNVTSVPPPTLQAQPFVMSSGGVGGVNNTVNNSKDEFDEWGDFQAFSNPSVSVGPTQVTGSTSNSQSIGCRLASLQDESPVHRFRNIQLTPSQPSQPSSLQISSSMSLHTGLSSLSVGNSMSQSKSQPSSLLDLDDDDFGDFAVSSSTVSAMPAPSPQTPYQPSMSLIPPAAPISATPAMKSKTFSTTFPIDQPVQPIIINNTFPIDQPIPAPKSFEIDKPIVSARYSFSIDEPIPAVPAVNQSKSEDKYSALRDLLDSNTDLDMNININPIPVPMMSSPASSLQFAPIQPAMVATTEDDLGDFGEFSSASKSEKLPLPPHPIGQKKQEPLLPFIGSIYNSTNPSHPNFPTLMTSPTSSRVESPDEWNIAPPPIPATNLPIFSLDTNTKPTKPKIASQQQKKPEDEEFDEWSLPPGMETPSEHPQVSQYRPPAAHLPFLSSSPPPAAPTLMTSSPPPADTEEFSLPSEQFGFSDQEIFGIKKQKPVSQSHKPQSIQDVIGLSLSKKASESRTKSPTEKPKEYENMAEPMSSSPSVSPDPGLMMTKVKSPECQSVMSLELETNGNSDIVSNSVENEEEPSFTPIEISSTKIYSEWLLVLTEIKALFETVRNTFDNIIYEDLKEELITHDQGKAYMSNFIEVYKVYKRILKSYRLKLSKEDQRPVVCKKMDQMILDIDSSWRRMEEHCLDYNPLPKHCNISDEISDVTTVCGICLCPGAEMSQSGSWYHAPCANYWVNCVNDVLPSLEKSM